MKHQIIRNTALVLSPFLLYVVIDDFYRVHIKKDFYREIQPSFLLNYSLIVGSIFVYMKYYTLQH